MKEPENIGKLELINTKKINSIDKNIINENCDYLSYITYNIWKKGMGNEGIDYIKGKVAQ